MDTSTAEQKIPATSPNQLLFATITSFVWAGHILLAAVAH